MTLKRVIVEFGTGSSLRRGDYTAACARAVKDALWHNSISFADAFDLPKEAMVIGVELACQAPDTVDTHEIAKIFPYGQISVQASKGGLDIEKPNGTGATLIAHAAIHVSLPVGERA